MRVLPLQIVVVVEYMNVCATAAIGRKAIAKQWVSRNKCGRKKDVGGSGQTLVGFKLAEWIVTSSRICGATDTTLVPLGCRSLKPLA